MMRPGERCCHERFVLVFLQILKSRFKRANKIFDFFLEAMPRRDSTDSDFS